MSSEMVAYHVLMGFLAGLTTAYVLEHLVVPMVARILYRAGRARR